MSTITSKQGFTVETTLHKVEQHNCIVYKVTNPEMSKQFWVELKEAGAINSDIHNATLIPNGISYLSSFDDGEQLCNWCDKSGNIEGSEGIIEVLLDLAKSRLGLGHLIYQTFRKRY